MKTLEQLKAERHLALERFTAALGELRSSYIDLAGLDRALSNRHVGGEVRSFVHAIEHLPEQLRHPEVPLITGERWSEEVRARALMYLEQI